MGRHPALTVFMVIFGIVLLLPGVCAIFFIAVGGVGPGSFARDPMITLLWFVSFLISVGGFLLLWKAFR